MMKREKYVRTFGLVELFEYELGVVPGALEGVDEVVCAPLAAREDALYDFFNSQELRREFPLFRLGCRRRRGQGLCGGGVVLVRFFRDYGVVEGGNSFCLTSSESARRDREGSRGGTTSPGLPRRRGREETGLEVDGRLFSVVVVMIKIVVVLREGGAGP